MSSQSWFVIEFVADWAGEDVEPQPQPAIESGAREAFTAGPIGRRVEYRFPIESVLARPISASAPVWGQAVRSIDVRASANAELARRVEFRALAEREPALHFAQLLRDDEELLLGAWSG